MQTNVITGLEKILKVNRKFKETCTSHLDLHQNTYKTLEHKCDEIKQVYFAKLNIFNLKFKLNKLKLFFKDFFFQTKQLQVQNTHTHAHTHTHTHILTHTQSISWSSHTQTKKQQHF